MLFSIFLAVDRPPARRVTLSMEAKDVARKMRTSGMTLEQIGGVLGVTKSAISRLMYRLRKEGNQKPRCNSGRRRKTTQADDRMIVLWSMRKPDLSVPKLKAILDTQTSINLSEATIKRRLAEAGLRGRRGAKKAWISQKNRKAKVKV